MPRLVQLLVKPKSRESSLPEITSFRLYQDLHTHHRFEIEVPFDMLETSATEFMSKSHQELVGKPIAISIEEDTLTGAVHKFRFRGIVTSLVMSSSNDYTGSFTIKGHSPTCLLTDGVQKRTFRDKTLANIVAQVLQPYPSNEDQVNVLKGTLIHTAPVPYVVQYQESNFDFLNRLLATYREWFYFDGTQLCIGQPPVEPEVSLFMDGYWSNFQVEAAIRPTNTSLYAYDATRHEHLTGVSGDASGTVATNSYAQFAVKTSQDVFTQTSHFPAPIAVRSISELTKAAKNVGGDQRGRRPHLPGPYR